MKKRALISIGCVLLFSSILAIGCGKKETATPKKDGDKKVYTSFYPMYDFAKKIAGNKMEVVNIVPVGSEPHEYELTTQNRKDLEKADMLIYNGLGMEGWVEDLKGAMKDKGLKFVEASKGVKALEHDHDHDKKGEEHDDHDHDKKGEEHDDHDHDKKAEKHDDHDHDKKAEKHDDHDHDKKAEKHDDHEEHDHHAHGKMDPHVWLSPINAKKQLENIKNAFVEIDSKNKDFYNANYEKYAKEFDDLDKKYKEGLSKYKGKNIVVNHEAFGYICDAYGIEQKGISGLSPETEPSPNKMAEIVDFVKKNQVKYVYFEEIASPKVSKAIAKEAGVGTLQLNTLEGLSEEEIKKGSDYISVMKTNLENLIKGFN